MAKKATATTTKHLEPVNRAVDVLTTEYMKTYATAVLEDRSIPALEDGLKPVQRRLLWSMHNLGLKDSGGYVKSARVVGDTLGRLHPHGDTAIYSALVRLASGIADPLVNGYGNWGGHAFEAAAQRYTECKFSSLGYNVFFDPFYLRATTLVPNYDGTCTEPVLLPSTYPMALVIGQSGIAVGTTTNIPSFTFESVSKVTRLLLKKGDKKTAVKATAKFLAKNLVFSSPYGGQVTSPEKDIIALMETGTGAISWSCDYVVDEKKGTITMTGFPPEWSFENRTRKIAELPYVASAVDQSDKDGVKFFVQLRKMSELEKKASIEKLCALFTCSVTYRVNVNRRVLNSQVNPPVVETAFNSYSIVDLFNNWMRWRLNFLEKNALLAEMGVLKARLVKLELRVIAIDNLEVIFKLLKTKGIDKVKELSKRLKITEEQAREIWSIAVGQLDRLSMTDTQNAIKKLKSEIKQTERNLRELAASALSHMQPAK